MSYPVIPVQSQKGNIKAKHLSSSPGLWEWLRWWCKHLVITLLLIPTTVIHYFDNIAFGTTNFEIGHLSHKNEWSDCSITLFAKPKNYLYCETLALGAQCTPPFQINNFFSCRRIYDDQIFVTRFSLRRRHFTVFIDIFCEKSSLNMMYEAYGVLGQNITIKECAKPYQHRSLKGRIHSAMGTRKSYRRKDDEYGKGFEIMQTFTH